MLLQPLDHCAVPAIRPLCYSIHWTTPLSCSSHQATVLLQLPDQCATPFFPHVAPATKLIWCFIHQTTVLLYPLNHCVTPAIGPLCYWHHLLLYIHQTKMVLWKPDNCAPPATGPLCCSGQPNYTDVLAIRTWCCPSHRTTVLIQSLYHPGVLLHFPIYRYNYWAIVLSQHLLHNTTPSVLQWYHILKFYPKL